MIMWKCLRLKVCVALYCTYIGVGHSPFKFLTSVLSLNQGNKVQGVRGLSPPVLVAPIASSAEPFTAAPTAPSLGCHCQTCQPPTTALGEISSYRSRFNRGAPCEHRRELGSLCRATAEPQSLP